MKEGLVERSENKELANHLVTNTRVLGGQWDNINKVPLESGSSIRALCDSPTRETTESPRTGFYNRLSEVSPLPEQDCHSALLTDLYELTMAAAYFENDFRTPASFELFV
jgi:hypothetical protein